MNTSLGIFLILLAVVAVFIIYCRINAQYHMGMAEGFISYNKDKIGGESITLPQYSSVNTLMKLYDSMYYDRKNRNLVQLFGTEYTGTTDISGTTLSSIDVIPIGGVTVSRFDVNANTPPINEDKTKLTVPLTFKSWIYPDVNVYSKLTPYQVIHVPYSSFDILHVYDTVNKKHINTVMYTNETADMSTNVINTYCETPSVSYNGSTAPIIFPTESFVDKNEVVPAISSKIKELYTNVDDIYQLTSRIFYDTYTGNLIINTGTDATTVKLDVYGRNPDSAGHANKLLTDVTTKIDVGNSILTTAIAVPASKTTLKSWIVADSVGKTTVLYIPSSVDTTTVIILLKIDPVNSAILTIQDVVLITAPVFSNTATTATTPIPSKSSITTPYNAFKIPVIPFKSQVAITPLNPVKSPDVSGSIPTVNTAPTTEDELEKVIGDYYSRYWKNNNLPTDGNFSTDFLLKTQIIPPICPACPACPSSNNSVCTNCGGNGGDGSLFKTASGSATTAAIAIPPYTEKIVKAGVDISGATPATAGGGTGTNLSGLTVSGVVDGAGNVTNSAVTNVGGVAGNIVGTTGHIAQNTVGVVGDVMEEAVNEVGDVTTGAIGVAGNITNKAVSTLGNVIGNSASTVNGLLGDPYGNIKNNLNRNQIYRNTHTYSGYNNGNNNSATANGAYGGLGFPIANVPKYNTQNSRTNPYGYYGGKPENTSEFLPVTANFSSFGK